MAPPLDMTIVLGAVACLVALWGILGVLAILVGQWALRRPMTWGERALFVVFTVPALSLMYRIAEKLICEGYYVVTGRTL